MPLEFTPVERIAGEVQELRRAFDGGVLRSVAARQAQLRAVARCLQENMAEFKQALERDLQLRPDARHNEVAGTAKEALKMADQLEAWVRPEKRAVPPLFLDATALVHKEPLGVVCVIAPWNYPLSLCVRPLIGALAAGNTVLAKPSELSEHTADALARLLPKYVDRAVLRVVLGGPKETTEVLRHRFDHIFYTGNGTVGRIVMRAAAEHLTPVTLELGGKSPLYVHKDVDLKKAVPRIASGKWLNCGQTCIAPDYVLVHRDLHEPFVRELQACVARFYGANPRDSADYGRIINSRHTERIQKLLVGQRVRFGGEVDVAARYISPTVVDNPPLDSEVMREEIFGPLLPVIPVDSPEEAVRIVNSKDKPLALYIFTVDKQVSDYMLANTSAGGGCVNEAVLHAVVHDLPFGGVGPSGIGAYNLRHTFELFSHHRGVLHRKLQADPDIRYPPFTEKKLSWLFYLNDLKLPSLSTIVAAVVLPIVAAAVYFAFYK